MLAGDESEGLQRLRELTKNLLGPEILAVWLEDLPVAFLAVNSRWEIVYFNAAAELVFGYVGKEVVGQSVQVLVPDVMREAHAQHLEHYQEDPRKRSMGLHMTISARTKDGREIPVEITLAPRMTTAGLMTSAVVVRRPRAE